MNSISNTLMETLEMFIGMAVTGFLVLSVVLFIVDGIKAKRQNRKRKTGNPAFRTFQSHTFKDVARIKLRIDRKTVASEFEEIVGIPYEESED